jgi:DNA-binding transcriptional MerR regulator
MIRKPPSPPTPPVDDGRPSGPFRIHVVAELTGVPEPTLRAWERRYGIPSPERTPSGYRLYGARDVDQVRQMIALGEAGMSPAEAARNIQAQAVGEEASAVPVDPYQSARERLIDAVEKFDDDALERTVQQLMFLGNVRALLDDVLVPTLVTIGDKWHRGEITVAQEHFASQRLGMLLRDLVRLNVGSTAETRVVLACFADEEHELGLLGVALQLARWEMKPVFLGARTPPSAVRNAVEATEAGLVALSLTTPPSPPRARELVDDYASACRGVPWIVGGSGAGAVADLVRARGGLVDPGDPAKLRTMVRHALHTDRQTQQRAEPSGSGSNRRRKR